MVRVHLTPPVFKRSPAHPCRMAGGFFIPASSKTSYPNNSRSVFTMFFQVRVFKLPVCSQDPPCPTLSASPAFPSRKNRKKQRAACEKNHKTAAVLPVVFHPFGCVMARRPKTPLSQNRNETGPQGAYSPCLSWLSSLASSRSFRGRMVKNSAFSSMVDLGCWKTSFPGFTGSSMAYR